MAEKILGIKLNIDTTDGAKFATITKEMATSVETVTKATDKLASHEAERIALLEKQNNAYAKLQNTVLNANNAIIEGTRGANLGWGNAERAVTRYNAVISETKDRLIALNAEQQRMIVLASQASAGAMASGGRASSTSNFVDQDRQAILRAARDARAAAEPVSASSITPASGGGLGSYTATGSANARLEAARATSNALAETERQTNARLLAEFQRYDQQARDLYAIHNGSRIRMEQEANNRMAALHTEALAMNNARTAAAASTAAHTAAVNQNSQALQTNVVQHQSLFVRIAEVMGAYKLLNITLQYTKQALIDIPKAGLEQQITESSLLGIFGTEKTASNLAFIKDVAEEAGQSLVVLEGAYRRYAPSAILAGASMEKVNKSFKDFAEVGTILHLPEDKINSLFLALDQMFAKGVVQSEEVKKQLGNVLPGAVEAFAQSMGKTPAAFMDSMKQNEVIAREAVPIFAAHYRKIFGGPDDSVFTLTKDRLQSNLNRLQTAYTLMDRAIFADSAEMMNNIVKAAAGMVSAIASNIKGIIQAIEVLSAVIMARLVGTAIKAAVVGFDALAAAASRALVMVTGLAAPELAVAAAVAYATAKIVGLGVAYDKVIGFTVTFHEKSYGLVNFLTSMFDEAMNNVYSVTDKIGAAFSYVADKLAFMQPVFEKMYQTLQLIAKVTPDLGLTKAFENTAIRAAIKDQRDYINSFEDIKKTQKDLEAGIAAGKFNAIDTGEGFSKEDLAQETQANIEEAKRKMLLIAEADHAILTDEDPLGASNATSSKALAKQKALLDQSNADIKNAGEIKIALLEKQKAAVEQSMVTVDGKVATPELQGRQQVQDIELKILSIKREVTRATELATLAAQKENAILENNALLLTKNKEAIYTAVRWQETRTKSDTEDATGTKGTFSGRGASAVSGSEKDKSRGSMQITESAWVDTGREAKDFADASMVELAKAGRHYLDQMINRFKDAEISLAAYNQGTGAVSAVYKKAGVKVGETDPEELAKVKANFTPLMKKYVSETMSTIPVQKGDITAITQQTTLNKLKADEAVQEIEIAQKKEKSNNDNIIYLSQYKAKMDALKASALIASGDTETGNTLKMNLKYQQMSAEYIATGNTEALKYIEILKQEEVSQSLITKAEQHLKDVTQEVNNQEVSINNNRQAGILTQEQAVSAMLDNKGNLLTAENAVEEALRRQLELSINIKENTQKIANIEAQKARNVAVGIAAQRSIVMAGDKTGLAGLVQTNVDANVANQAAKASQMGNIDPTLSHQKQQDAKSAITKKALATELSANLQMYSGIAAAGSQTFGMLTSEMIKHYGAKSTQARAAFAMTKAMNISECIMNTATAIMAAQKLPPPMSTIVTAIDVALGAIQLGLIMAQPMPAAHGGLTNVPEEQTYLLQKGERVLSPNQNADLNKFMAKKVESQSSTTTGVTIGAIHVTVPPTQEATPESHAAVIGVAIRAQIESLVQQQLADSKRSGGSLNPTKMAANF